MLHGRGFWAGLDLDRLVGCGEGTERLIRAHLSGHLKIIGLYRALGLAAFTVSLGHGCRGLLQRIAGAVRELSIGLNGCWTIVIDRTGRGLPICGGVKRRLGRGGVAVGRTGTRA